MDRAAEGVALTHHWSTNRSDHHRDRGNCEVVERCSYMSSALFYRIVLGLNFLIVIAILFLRKKGRVTFVLTILCVAITSGCNRGAAAEASEANKLALFD